MLEEMTADFKFDPSNSSAEEPKQETKKQKAVQQRENQSKKTQKSNPQKYSKVNPKQKAKMQTQEKRQLPPRSTRTQAAEKITQQLTKTKENKKVDLSLKEGSCGATSRPSRFPKNGSRTPSPNQQRQTRNQHNPNSWRQRSQTNSPGPMNPNGHSPRAMSCHHSVSPPRPMPPQQQTRIAMLNALAAPTSDDSSNGVLLLE